MKTSSLTFILSIFFIFSLFTKTNAQDNLFLGQWHQNEKTIDNEILIMVIDSNYLDMHIDSIVSNPYHFKYMIKDNYMIYQDINEGEFIDSTEIISISKDKMILKMKEKGVFYNRTFSKLNK
jgi:hypothetical protein